MGYTPRSRDRYKNLLALLTGMATFGSIAATGTVTGLAAHQSALRDQEREQAQSSAASLAVAASARAVQPLPWTRTITITKTRPHRTVIHTRVVHQVSQSGVAGVGAGGTISSPSYSSGATYGSSSSTASSSSGQSAPQPAPAAAPAPAPSSGS